jgi:hypothetical protein
MDSDTQPGSECCKHTHIFRKSTCSTGPILPSNILTLAKDTDWSPTVQSYRQGLAHTRKKISPYCAADHRGALVRNQRTDSDSSLLDFTVRFDSKILLLISNIRVPPNIVRDPNLSYSSHS